MRWLGVSATLSDLGHREPCETWATKHSSGPGQPSLVQHPCKGATLGGKRAVQAAQRQGTVSCDVLGLQTSFVKPLAHHAQAAQIRRVQVMQCFGLRAERQAHHRTGLILQKGRRQARVGCSLLSLQMPFDWVSRWLPATSLGARLRTRGGPCIRCDHLKWVRAQCSIQATSQPGANRPADWHASSASVAPGSAAARLQCRNQRRRSARNPTVNRCHATQSTSPRRGRPVGGSFRKPRTVTSGFELTLALPRGRQRGRRFEESSPFEMEEPERRCQHVPLPEFGPLLAD